jgi:hypothetical protein
MSFFSKISKGVLAEVVRLGDNIPAWEKLKERG